MKRLEKITPDYAECTLSNSEMNMVKGGNMAEGDKTTHTSQTTGWRYPDVEDKNGDKEIDFEHPIMP